MPFPPRFLPAVCGGDVRAVVGGAGRTERLRRLPAHHSVSKLYAVHWLRSVFHVCPCWHLLLLPVWSTLPPDWSNNRAAVLIGTGCRSLEEDGYFIFLLPGTDKSAIYGANALLTYVCCL